VSTSKLDLNVLLVFFRIWWVDFGVFSAGEGVEKVIGQGFGFVEGYFHVAVKFFCEGVAIVDAEDSFEEINVYGASYPMTLGIFCRFIKTPWGMPEFSTLGSLTKMVSSER
jgi:hypothetical protein